MYHTTVKILEKAKELKISDQAICRMVNGNRSKVDDWKKGKSKPTLEEIEIIAVNFSVPISYIIGTKTLDETDSLHFNDIELALIRKCRKLNIDGQLKVIAYTDDLISSNNYSNIDNKKADSA